MHISAVERAGLSDLNEGQVVDFEEVSHRGKTSAENLKIKRCADQAKQRAPSLERNARLGFNDVGVVCLRAGIIRPAPDEHAAVSNSTAERN